MTLLLTCWPRLSLAAAVLALSLPTQAATEHTAYYEPVFSDSSGFLIKWQTDTQTARLARHDGARPGSYTVVGTRRRLVVNPPYISQSYEFDSCGEQVLIHYETDTFLIGVASGDSSSGSSTVNKVGRRRVMNGCDAGQVDPIGSEDDPGMTLKHVAMSLTPGMSDLKKDRRMAGFYEAPLAGGLVWSLPQDVVSFSDRGHVRFERTGQSYARSTHPDGWLVLQLPSGPRGFLRVARDSDTGGETWLVADLVDGQPAWAAEVDMVAVDSAASFGGPAAAARNWRSRLLFAGLEYRLYPDQTGVRYRYRDGIIEPVVWGLNNERLTITRDLGSANRVRHWEPLRRKGKRQWVMEDDTWTYSDGSTTRIEPRVNLYVDKGVGSPPAATRQLTQSPRRAAQEVGRQGTPRLPAL